MINFASEIGKVGALGRRTCMGPIFRRFGGSAIIVISLSCFWSAGVPLRATAQPEALRLRAAVTGGAMTSTDQQTWLGFSDPAVGGHVDIGYALTSFLTPEVRFGGAYFLSPHGDGGLFEIGVGASVELQAPDWLSYGGFAHLNLAWTGPLLLPSIDVGVRAAIRVSESLAIGPEVSYGNVFWDGGERTSSDAQFWMAGIAITWRPFTAEPEVVTQTVTTERVEREIVPVDHYLIDSSPLPIPDSQVSIERLLDNALPVTRREERTLIPPVLFEFDSTNMLPCGEVSLHAAREVILRSEGQVRIDGHADGTGTDEYNQDLSLARASRVRDWLVNHGIDGDRLEVSARGETAPLEEETSDEFRQINRRVTFVVTRITEGTATESVDVPIGVSCEGGGEP